MKVEDFRKHAHALADWMADYFEQVDQYPVLPELEPGEVRDQLPPSPPIDPVPFEDLFRDFESIILPGMTHWQHPGFMAYFPASRSEPSVLAEMLTATLGAQCMIWYTSPAAAELEERMMEWLREALALPGNWQGAIQETASAANLIALLMAREQKTGWAVNRSGFYDRPRMRIYASDQIHSSVEKGVKIAGFGSENLVWVETDERFAMRPQALEKAIRNDLESGMVPTCVVAAMGTTSSTALDPLRPIGEICKRYGCFFHVDAAYAGTALLLPEMRWMSDGLELADSFVFNPHKWMFTNFDCSAFYVRDKENLLRTFSILPEYLRTPQDEKVNNYRDWGIQLGRRFRALKLWFVIRSFGLQGLQDRIREHIAIGQWLEGEIRRSPDFELMAPVPLNLVCFRYLPDPGMPEAALDQLNEALLARINKSGRFVLTQTRLDGKFTIRLVAGQTRTTKADVSAAWELIQSTARALTAE